MAALFTALTPGVLLRFPKNGSKLAVAAVHGLVFVVIFCLTQRFISRMGRRMGLDGFQSAGVPASAMGSSPGIPASAMGSSPGVPASAMGSSPGIPASAMGSSPGVPTSSRIRPSPSGIGRDRVLMMNMEILGGPIPSGVRCMSGSDCTSGVCVENICT